MPLPMGQLPPIKEQSLCWCLPSCPPHGVSLAITSTPSVSHLPAGQGVCYSRLVPILVSGDQLMRLLSPLGPKIQ